MFQSISAQASAHGIPLSCTASISSPVAGHRRQGIELFLPSRRLLRFAPGLVKIHHVADGQAALMG